MSTMDDTTTTDDDQSTDQPAAAEEFTWQTPRRLAGQDGETAEGDSDDSGTESDDAFDPFAGMAKADTSAYDPLSDETPPAPDRAAASEHDYDRGSAGVQASGNKSVSADEQSLNHADEDRLRPSSDRMGLARVEANNPAEANDPSAAADAEDEAEDDDEDPLHPSDRHRGQTLVGHEKSEARRKEAETATTRGAANCREHLVAEDTNYGGPEGTPLAALEPADPLAGLPEDQRAAVEEQAERIHEDVLHSPGLTVITHELGRHLREGKDMVEAAVRTTTMAQAAGPFVAIGHLGEAYDHTWEAPWEDHRVDVRGEIATLWDPRGSGVQQVGLIEDETGQAKFTVWRSARTRGSTPSGASWHDEAIGVVEEGEEWVLRHVKLREYKRNGEKVIAIEIDHESDCRRVH